MAYSASPIVSESFGSPDKNGFTTSAIDTTGCDILYVAVVEDGDVDALSDSKGNTWHLDVETHPFSVYTKLYSCQNPVVGSGHTFTVGGTNSAPALTILGFSGSASSPLDQTNSASGGFGSTVQPGSVTPTQDNELLLTVVEFHGGSGASYAIDSGFTIAESLDGNLFYHGIAIAYQVQTTATARNPTWSGGNSNYLGTVIATYKAGTSGAAAATKIQFVNAGAQSASNASPQTPAIPTNTASGDAMYLYCVQASAAAITFTPPAGWTSIGRNSNATRSMTIEVFRKIAASGESAPSVACGTPGSGWATQIVTYRYVDEAYLVDATAVASDAAAAATFQPTGITTKSVNAWVISAVCSKDDNALNFNTANGYTARMSGASYDDTAGNGSDYAVGWADQEFATAGAKTCPTWNQSANGNDAWVALTFAITPKSLIWGGKPDGYIGGAQMAQLLAT